MFYIRKYGRWIDFYVVCIILSDCYDVILWNYIWCIYIVFEYCFVIFSGIKNIVRVMDILMRRDNVGNSGYMIYSRLSNVNVVILVFD